MLRCILDILLVAMTIGYVACKERNCDTVEYSNGCSIPLKAPFFYKETFKKACNKHDICYYCRRRFGLSRKACDDRFKKNMKSICNKRKSVERWTCKRVVEIYYAAVRKGGVFFSNSAPPKWCKEKWVSKCI